MVHASFTLCPVLQSCKHSKSIQTVYEITCTTVDFQLWEDEINLLYRCHPITIPQWNSLSS